MRFLALHIALLAFVGIASAQFGFFDQMFGHGHQQQRQRQEPQDSPSDASQYRHTHAQIRCSNYVCPDTLACVHFPHHCPCAWPQEDKFELADGQRICVSKGGFKEGEAARKVELARKGML